MGAYQVDLNSGKPSIQHGDYLSYLKVLAPISDL
jgi:hypothetical protein